MQITMLQGKIHRVTVKEARVDYVGSITVDPALLEAAGIREYQLVQVVNVTNGARLETYTIASPKPGDGMVCLNGAAAHSFAPGDVAIIMSYAQMATEEAETHQPKVVFVDEENRPVRIAHYEKAGALYQDEREA